MDKISRALDSWPLLAYFQNQPAAPKVVKILQESYKEGSELLISTVNWGEVLYAMDRQWGPQKRDEAEGLIEQMHLRVLPVDQPMAREAARFKARYRLGYADCFAAAAAFLKEGELVTGDPDFRVLKGEIRIHWL